MWEKIKNYVITSGAFLMGLAGYIVFSRNRVAEKAGIKLGQGREEDAASAQRHETARDILARIQLESSQIPEASPDRTPSEVEAELIRRGHVK